MPEQFLMTFRKKPNKHTTNAVLLTWTNNKILRYSNRAATYCNKQSPTAFLEHHAKHYVSTFQLLQKCAINVFMHSSLFSHLKTSICIAACGLQ